MKALVIGAAGKTGKLVVEKSLAAGHDITVLVHTHPDQGIKPEQSHFFPSRVNVYHGDARNPSKLDQAMLGQDAVIDCIGGEKPFLTTDLETSASQVVVEVMKRNRVKRLIVVSALGEGDSKSNTGFFYERILMPTFLRGVIEDKAKMEDEVNQSGLDYTIVRPPILSDSDDVGTLHVVEPGEIANKISRTDLAQFLVDQLEDPTYIGQAVTIASR